MTFQITSNANGQGAMISLKHQLLILGGIVSAFVVLMLAFSQDTRAQDAGGEQGPSHMCMVYHPKGEGHKPSLIIVPQTNASAMAAKGFAPFECGQRGFGLKKQLEFRDFVCRIAAEHSDGMQQQFEAVLGERPATLCGMAELALGSWSREEVAQ